MGTSLIGIGVDLRVEARALMHIHSMPIVANELNLCDEGIVFPLKADI